MRKPENIRDKIFVRPGEYSLHLRVSRGGRLELEAISEFVLSFVLSGAIRARSEFSTTELGKGGVILLAPGEILAANFGGQSDILVLTISPALVLDCAVRARLTRDDAQIAFRENLVDADARVSRIASDMTEELREDSAGRDVVIASLVELTLVHVLRQHAKIQKSAGLELSRAGLVDRRIRRAVELMHAHLGRELPLEELASAAHLSPFHFSRLFKKLTGATPHAYLATLRVSRAQTLLTETDLSITEVAARVGYAGSSHFSKAFRRATGLSPRAVRNALVRP